NRPDLRVDHAQPPGVGVVGGGGVGVPVSWPEVGGWVVLRGGVVVSGVGEGAADGVPITVRVPLLITTCAGSPAGIMPNCFARFCHACNESPLATSSCSWATRLFRLAVFFFASSSR